MTGRASVALTFAALLYLAAGRLGDTRPALCAEEVVRETCVLVDPAGTGARPAAMQELFSATGASVEAFWRAAGLPAEAAQCADLCGNTTRLLKSMGRLLPRASDTGCYESGGEATMFFGRPALVSRAARERIQMVMNSVNNALSNATFVYLGPRCTARSFAYVYPCRGGDFHERDPRGRLYVHLCDMFFRVPSEQICTLVHEASHHTMACTDDAQYGARGCQRLARTKPADSLRNADSYGYYIREVARTFGTV